MCLCLAQGSGKVQKAEPKKGSAQHLGQIFLHQCGCAHLPVPVPPQAAECMRAWPPAHSSSSVAKTAPPPSKGHKAALQLLDSHNCSDRQQERGSVPGEKTEASKRKRWLILCGNLASCLVKYQCGCCYEGFLLFFFFNFTNVRFIFKSADFE